MTEQDKLTGTFMNNIAAAAVIFGMIRPMIEGAGAGLPSLLAMAGWVVIGIGAPLSAREFIRTRE